MDNPLAIKRNTALLIRRDTLEQIAFDDDSAGLGLPVINTELVAGTSYYLVIQYYNVPVRAGTADIILEPAAPAQDAPVEVPPVAPAPPEVRREPVAAPEGVETTAPTGSGGSQSGQ